jgi:predicted transcriptional regulator of viral defense system
MNDRGRSTPDHRRLFEVASEQGGYFTAKQARKCGFSWAVLSHHARTGTFIRVLRGLYRIREYPSSAREDVIAAWLAVGSDTAVVSHESALDLLGLSDVVPQRVHVTVPRARRGRSTPPGVRLHTTKLPLGPDETLVVEGVRVTSPARSIADAAAAGASPEHVIAAARQALARGMVTPAQLERAAGLRGPLVERMIRRALGEGSRS